MTGGFGVYGGNPKSSTRCFGQFVRVEVLRPGAVRLGVSEAEACFVAWVQMPLESLKIDRLVPNDGDYGYLAKWRDEKVFTLLGNDRRVVPLKAEMVFKRGC